LWRIAVDDQETPKYLFRSTAAQRFLVLPSYT
jgi:hypothetical protein